jgi:hypothetical protein
LHDTPPTKVASINQLFGCFRRSKDCQSELFGPVETKISFLPNDFVKSAPMQPTQLPCF